MKTSSLLLSLTAYIIASCVFNIRAQDSEPNERNPYLHRESPDPRGRYQLEWLVNWEEERILFNVTVATQGYVALGLARNGKMEGADIAIGGVASDGEPYFSDYHAIGNEQPILDESQNWVLHSSMENSSHTFLSFSRPFVTCDQHDIPINDDALYVLWAYGEQDNVNQSHFQNRGAFITYLRDPDLTPRIVREDTSISETRRPQFQNVEIWTVQDQVTIPAKRTTYWCTIKKFSPSSPGKRHIIGHNVRMNTNARNHMHHTLLTRCTIPSGLNPALIFEPFINFQGEECYNIIQPTGKLPTAFCTELVLGHAIGGKPFFFPEHVGTPIGEKNSEEYYLLQIHYDNPTERPNINVQLEIDIYYTDQLRENDDATFNIGQHVPGSPSILLPPRSIDHRIHGHCASFCLQKMLPAQGIKVFAVVLHSHNAGRKLRVQHFRNGRELPWLLADNNYKFQFQNRRLLRNEVTVMPGDHLVMTCNYDTADRNETVVGGYGTDQEMCQGFLQYYNKLEDYPTCRSELISPEYSRRYLAGLMNTTWDESRLENVATAPPNLAGMTISEISDSPYVNWNISQRSRLQRDHIIHPQVSICPSLTEVAAALLFGIQAPPEFVSFPVEVVEYKEPDRCSL